MRFLWLAAFLSASLAAQTAPPSEQNGKTRTEAPPAAAEQKSPEAPKVEKPPLFKLDRKSAMRLFEQQRKGQYSNPQADRGLTAPKPGGKLTLKPGQPCAIPLINVLPPGPNPDPGILGKVPPRDPSGDKFAMKDVIPPAPSCDDVK